MKRVSQDFIINRVIKEREPKGKFYYKTRDNIYLAVDNSVSAESIRIGCFKTFKDIKLFFKGVSPQKIRDDYEETSSYGVEVNSDSIRIKDQHGEIASWTEDEWQINPEIVPGIINTINMFYNFGELMLRETINNEVFE